MARVTYVKSARKDNPVAKVGEPYYWWKFQRGPKNYSKTRPLPSQLTSSDKLSRLYAAVELITELPCVNPDDVVLTKELVTDAQSSASDAMDAAISDATEVADEYRESAESIRENFSESPTADECEEKADSIESWCDELGDLKNQVDDLDCDTDDPDLLLTVLSALEDLLSQAGGSPL